MTYECLLHSAMFERRMGFRSQTKPFNFKVRDVLRLKLSSLERFSWYLEEKKTEYHTNSNLN